MVGKLENTLEDRVETFTIFKDKFAIMYKVCTFEGVGVIVLVLNATFNNISVISWRSVILVEETGVPGENHRHAASH